MSPRFASKGRRGFIWLPREETITWDIKIDSVSVRNDVIAGEFTKGVCPEVGNFKISLINADGSYSDKYSLGTTVQFYMDFADGSTERFEGKIDKIPKKYDLAGYTLEVSGAHLSRDLMDITVNKSYDQTKTIEEIAQDLIDTDLAGLGFTLNFTSTATNKPKINWDEKTVWDCFNDLRKLAEPDADVHINDSKVIQFFDKNSIENNNEAIVWNDTLISLSGLGEQSITTKNKIKVFGDDGTGLPIIHISDGITSQADYGIKTLPIFDTNVTSALQAEELADAERTQLETPETEGEAECFLLPSLSPGDKIWVTNPPIKIKQQVRIYKFTHKVPIERTNCMIGKERKLPQLFKKRVEKELASKKVTNPFGMTSSWNLTFDDETDIGAKDTNVQISNGILSLSSGSQGSFTASKIISTDLSEVNLRAVGSVLVGTVFELSTDGGSNYQTLTLEGKDVLDDPIVGSGNILLRVTIQSASTEIDSLALLSK